MAQSQQHSKTWNVLLWIVQGLMALTLVWASGMKLLSSADQLAAMWPWTADHAALVKFTGVIDLLAALGLVLPGLQRIQPKLTIYAALGTIALMLAAIAFHLSRGEGSQIGFNLVFLALAGLVVWGRMKKAPY